MRLYLSSFRLGNQPRRLAELVGGHKHAAVILNAVDAMPEDQRRERVEQELAALRGLGFGAAELDLRQYFRRERGRDELRALLAGCGLVWVRGGNTFVLRRAMKASGFDEVIPEALGRDALVYGGFSAGVSVLAPSLRGGETVDDPHEVPAGYDPEVVWEGLGILPYAVAPHYKSGHPETPLIEKKVQYLIDHHLPFIALRDGEAIVVDGAREEIVC